MITVLLTMVGRILADNLTVNGVTIKAGETQQVSIVLNNPSHQYAAFQFDLLLPEGFSIAKNANGKLIASLNEDRKDDHTLTVTDVGGGTYRFLSFSMSNAEFYGTGGALVDVMLEAASEALVGTKTATIKSQVFTEVSGTQYKWAEVPFQITVEEAVVPVTITAKSYSREYGEANPAFEFTSSGATLNGTPEITCEATETSPVGTYPIVIKKGSVTNSGDTYVNGTLTITKAPLTVTAQSITREYGEENPKLECTYSGFKNEDTAENLTTQPFIVTTATSMSSVGTYDIIVSGGEAQNYEFNYVAGTLTIVPKGIAAATVTVADSCAYTGNPVIPDVTVELNGQVLTERTDYILTLSENIRTGVASLTITGAGNYTGSVTKTFVIFNPQPTVDDLLPDEGDNNGASDYSNGESGVNESTDLNEKVVGSVYYCITPDAGGYDAEEGCLVINKAATTVSTELPAVDGQLPSASNGFRGLVFFVNAGRGKVKIKAETTGNLLLCVKIAGELVMSMAVEGKTTLTIPYDVSQPSEVLVYAGFAAGSRGKAPSTMEDALKIYSLEWESEPTAIGIEKIENGKLKIENYYDLNGRKVNGQLKKGVYIIDGRKRVVK